MEIELVTYFAATARSGTEPTYQLNIGQYKINILFYYSLPQDISTRMLFSTEQFDTMFRMVAIVETLSDLNVACPRLQHRLSCRY